MARKALKRAQSRAIFTDHRRSFIGQDTLIGAGLEELADPQSAGIARRFFGGERMVGANNLVTIADIGTVAEKQRAVVGHVLEEIIGVCGHHLHML